MEKLRNKKILTIIVLVVAVVGLSVGFAAFSSVLTISSEAQVNPDASTFSVKFSKVSDRVLDGEDNLVEPVTYPSFITTEEEKKQMQGLITNTDKPTITGLKAMFKAPGESIQYKFYVRNEGEYLAYLNSIEIGSKSCTPGTGTNTSLVSDACDAINVSVKVGSMNEVTSTQENITGQTLAANSYQEVIVTIAYDENGARADGPFSVKLGDIYLTYSSIQDFEFVQNEKYTGVIYRNSKKREITSIGADITLDESCLDKYDYASDVMYEACYEKFSYETDYANLNLEYNMFLKHDVENNIIISNYVCTTYEEDGVRKEACLRGGETYFESNTAILRSIEPYFSSCDFDEYNSECRTTHFVLEADSYGNVGARYNSNPPQGNGIPLSGKEMYCSADNIDESYCYFYSY